METYAAILVGVASTALVICVLYGIYRLCGSHEDEYDSVGNMQEFIRAVDRYKEENKIDALTDAQIRKAREEYRKLKMQSRPTLSHGQWDI